MNPKELLGKTIKSINSKAINAWHIEFTDGTAVTISCEVTGPIGLAALNLEKAWK